MSRRQDPCDLDGVRQQVAQTLGPEAAQAIRIREIVIEENALPVLTDRIERSGSDTHRVVLVWDDRPMQRGAESLKPLVHQAVGASKLPIRLVELPRDLHADNPSVRIVLDALDQQSVVIGVGSGNLVDTCKHAVARYEQEMSGHIPLICWPTANSVNAYTSSLAILVVNGVKRSLPSVTPDMILCDLPTLMSAPRPMQQAGLGDMLSRCIAPGDWYLAHVLGMDDSYSEAAYLLLSDTEQAVLDAARAIGLQTLEGTRILTEALLLSGLVLSATDQTAPLSGWEHVISHYLDLVNLAHSRPLGLHGAQVGVAAIVAARAYDMLLQQARPVDYPASQIFPQPDTIRSQIQNHFGPLDPDGLRRAELWRDCRKKLHRWHDQEGSWQSFCADWQAGTIQAQLTKLVRRPVVVTNALAAAGAPTTFDQLDPPVDTVLAHGAIRNAHLIRRRFTLGDLLSSCGLLNRIALAEGIT